MGFSFPFLRANDLRLFLLNIRARSFYSLVLRGYICNVSVQLVPKYFPRDCSTDSFSCSKQKTRKKTRLKQGSKSRKENLNVVVVANPPGSISLRCRTTIPPLSYRYRYAVALLLLRCCTAITLLLFCCCSAVVAMLSHRYCTGIPPLLLRCCCSCCRHAVAPLSLRCRTIVEPLLLRPRDIINNSNLNCCCSTVTPLLLLLSIRRFTRLSPQEA